MKPGYAITTSRRRPSSTIDGDTTFFRRMGFCGWGARLDYIVQPGLAWAVEGFSLRNHHDTAFLGSMKELVFGTSLTAYF